MCLVLQGTKKVLIGTEITHYGSGSYVLSAIDMPISGQVVEASVAQPYLGVRINLDAREIAAQIIESKLSIPKNSHSRRRAYVEESDVELQEAFLRLAFKVGYESPSQFGREYRRLFGASPLQDMEYLKHHELDR